MSLKKIKLYFFNQSIESINSLLLFLLIISLLFREHWISKSVILISLFTAFLLIKKNIKLNQIKFYGFSLFFLFGVFSLFWSIDIENSFPKLISYLPFIIIPIWATSFNSKIRYDLIFKYVGIVFVFISFSTILMAFLRFNTTHQITEFYYHNLSSPLSTSAIYLSLLYLIIFLFNLFFILRIKEKANAFNYFILIILFIYILLLSSKMIIILLVLITCFIVYKSYKPRLNKRKVLLIGLLLTSTFFVFMILSKNISNRFNEILNIEKVKEVYVKNEFGDTYLWNGLNLRLLQLRAFYDIEKNDNFNSLIGVGLSNSQTLLNERYRYYKLYSGEKWGKNVGYLSYNFHNQYAQTLIELGIIGFLFLLYIFYCLIINAKTNNNFLLYSVIIILILIMFTESVLARQKGVVFFVLFPLIAIKIKEYIDQNN